MLHPRPLADRGTCLPCVQQAFGQAAAHDQPLREAYESWKVSTRFSMKRAHELCGDMNFANHRGKDRSMISSSLPG